MAVTDDYLRKVYPQLFGNDAAAQPDQLSVKAPQLTLPPIPFYSLNGMSQLPQTSQVAPGSAADQALQTSAAPAASPDAAKKAPDAFDYINAIFSGGRGGGGAASINPFHSQGSGQGGQAMTQMAKSMMGK